MKLVTDCFALPPTDPFCDSLSDEAQIQMSTAQVGLASDARSITGTLAKSEERGRLN
jgi:hypothetical protein